MPRRSPLVTTLSETSPRLAYMRMLRAISEIAAAMTVWSPLENPACAARSRPRCRAVTTSTSAAIGISSSSATVYPCGPALDAELRLAIEKRQTLLEVEGGRNPFQRQTELHHRERDLRLDPDDHGLGATQTRHVGDVPQRPDCERVHHVQRSDVDDYAAGTKPPDALDERLTQLREIGVG